MRVLKKISTPFTQSKPDKAIIVLNSIDPQLSTIKMFIQGCDDYDIGYTVFCNKSDVNILDTKSVKEQLGLHAINVGSVKTGEGIEKLKKYLDLWSGKRIVILGVFNSGKTSIINCLCDKHYKVGDIPGTTLKFTETKLEDGTVVIDSVGQLIDIHKPMMVSIDFTGCSNIDEKINRVFEEEIKGIVQTKEGVVNRIKEVICVIKEQLKKGNKIIVTGAGASALVAKEIAGQGTECGLPIMVFTNDGAEIQPVTFSKGLGEQEGGISRYIANAINPGDIVIAVSASGGTGFTYDLLKRAKDKGAHTIAITENSDTPLGNYADYILKSDSKPEGPCLHPETPVMEVSKGLINVSDIKIGDEILSVKKSKTSDDNHKYKNTRGFFNRGLKWTRVNGISKSKAKKLLEIRYKGGGSIKVTSNHLFFDSRGREVLAKNLEVGTKLFKPKYGIDLQEFDKSDKLKLLAYFTAEGSTGKGSIIFTINSKELAEGLIGDNIIKYMKSEYNLNPTIKYKHNGTTCDLWFFSVRVMNELIELCGKGAWNKHVPYYLNRVDKKSFSRYLMAIIEGDGYITKGGRARLRSVSKKLIVELGWICQMHDIPYSIVEFTQPEREIRGRILKESRIWQLQIGRNGWNELCGNNKPNIIDGVALIGECKKDLNKPLKSTAIIKSITELDYSGDVYDLVDVEGNCFYVGDYPVLTHNSSSKIQTAHLVIGHTLMLVLADELGLSADRAIGYMLPEALESKKMGLK